MEYYVAVLQLIAHMARTRPTVSLSPRPFEATLISVARNVLATKALTAGFDYLLFIDADMGFQPSLIDKMLDANQPIVATIYPKRATNFEHLHHIAGSHSDAKTWRHVAQRYVGGDDSLVGMSAVAST